MVVPMILFLGNVGSRQNRDAKVCYTNLMTTWGRRRQILYFVGALSVFALLAAGVYILLIPPVQLCEDGSRPPCKPLIGENIIVRWTRVFRVSKGVYDVASLVENPNETFGLDSFPYKFKAYDAENVLVYERTGQTVAQPRERFLIIETQLNTGARVPVRATIELGPHEWRKPLSSPRSLLFVRNGLFLNSPGPRLSADLVNSSLVELSGVRVGAVVTDENGEALGVSSTSFDGLGKNGTRQIVFTWPTPFLGTSFRFEIFPRVLGEFFHASP